MKNLLKNTLFWALLALLAVAGTAYSPSNERAETAPPPCLLPPPTGLVPTHITPTSVRLKWNPVQGAIEYRVRIQNPATGQSLGTIVTDQTFAQKNGLAPGTLYRFSVQARCSTGMYSAQAAMRDVVTGIIIVDVIVQNCCPLPSNPTTEPSGGTDTFCLSTGIDDAWHIRAEKFNSATTYYDFCLRDSNLTDLQVLEYDKSNTYVSSNTGSQVTVKSGTANFLIIKSVSYDAVTSTLCCVVNWKTKMKVQAAYCDTTPFTGQADDRRFQLPRTDGKASVAPNPFGQQLQVFLPENAATISATATLFDPQGRMVARLESTEPRIVFDTRHLPDGLYFLKIQQGATMQTIRVVKKE